jgi:hypothetical protein
MVAGSELSMAALAVGLAVVIVRDRAGAVRRAAAPAAELTAYNAYLASLDPSRMFTGSDRR